MSGPDARPATPSRATPWVLVAAWVALALAIFSAAAPRDYESLSVKHYLSHYWGLYYGGYGEILLESHGERRLLHYEAESNYRNALAFSERGKGHYTMARHPAAVDRVYAAYLAAIASAATGGWLSVPGAFTLLNVLMWLGTALLAGVFLHRVSGDREAGAIAAILVVAVPTFWLMLGSLKGQALGAAFLMATATALLRVRACEAFLPRATFFFLVFLVGQYASGGWFLLLLYLGCTALLAPSIVPRSMLWPAIAGLVAARLAIAPLNAAYDFRMASQVYDVRAILVGSVDWLRALAAGSDLSKVKLLNYAGTEFFDLFLKNMLVGLLDLCPLLVPLALLAALRDRIGAWLAAMSVPLLAGHAGNMLTGWTFIYGYGSAGTVLFLCMAAALAVSRFVSGPALLGRLAGWIALAAMVGMMTMDLTTGRHRNFNNWYDNQSVFFDGPARVYHDERRASY